MRKASRSQFSKRAPSSHIAPALLVRAIALLTLITSLALLPPTPAEAQTQTLWSATLTVDEDVDTANSVRRYGCSGALFDALDNCTSSSVLTDKDFVHNGATYQFVFIVNSFDDNNGKTNPKLEFAFAYPPGQVPNDIRTSGKLNVTAGGTTTTLNFSNASYETWGGKVTWTNPGFTWTNGQSVSLSITMPPTAPTAPTLTTPLSNVSYGSDSRNRPTGSDAWRESFAFTSSTALTGTLSANIATACATGTTLEAGWYKSDAPSTRLGTFSSSGNSHTLTYTPTAAGEYRALAYCVRGTGTSKTNSTAVNLMRGGAVTVDSSPPTFKLAQVRSKELTIAFSEPMGTAKAGNGAFNVQVNGTSRNNVTSYTLSGDTATLTLTSPIKHGQTVTVAYTKPGSGPVLQDRAGNALATFPAKTVHNLSLPPTVSTYEPADDANSVAVGANLVLTFSESVKTGAGNITIKPSGSTPITISVTNAQVVIGSGANNNKVTINPTDDLTANTDYAVRIDAGAFKDLEDNNYQGITDDTTWNFRTAAERQQESQLPDPPDPVASVNVTHNGSSLTVSWDAPARADTYDVTYSGNGVNARAAWNRAGTELTITCDSRPEHQNQNCVSGGTTYTVGVRARNAGGESAWTNSAPASLSAPDPVASVNVTHNGSSLTVSWDAPARAATYDVTYSGNGVNARAAWNRAGTDLTITCDSRPEHQNQNCVSGGTTYTVGVRARNAAGESAWTNSAPASVSAPTPQSAPDPVASVNVTHNGSSLTVSWAAPARAATYDVTYSGNGVNARAAWNRAGTDLTITCDSRPEHQNQNCVSGGTTYTVGVRARNAGGESAWTNSAPASLSAPDPVASVNVTHNGSSLTVSWDAPARAATYDVTYSGNGVNARAAWNRAGTELTITCDSRPEHQNQNCVSSGTTYTVGVRARNAAGESAWTNSAPTSFTESG